MTPTERRVSTANDAELAVDARLSSVNAVFTLSLILTQATSPGQVMRLVTTAVPAIAPGQKALAWHPSRSGDYYERAPDKNSDELARLTGRLSEDGLSGRALEEIAQTVQRVVDKLLHAPTVRVKELASSPGGEEYDAALRVLFDLDPRAVEAVTGAEVESLNVTPQEGSQ